jgi:GTP diphosphokinase / guanosine-3',5'-bis(diphosphate) 3'-diphosphatase
LICYTKEFNTLRRNFTPSSMFGLYLEALRFAAEKHLTQRRKGCEMVPYINHPIKVVHLLYKLAETDVELLSAAVLHDVLEDTCTTEDEMREKFGDRITNLVLEVTDDMTMTYDDRKRYQIRKAPGLTDDAKRIKIADKICNIEDILTYPLTWSERRKYQYFEWSAKVVDGCRGVNPILENLFDETLKRAMGSMPGRS